MFGAAEARGPGHGGGRRGANEQRSGEVGERRRAVFVFGPVEGIINQGWPRDRARKSLCVRARRCRPGKVFSK